MDSNGWRPLWSGTTDVINAQSNRAVDDILKLLANAAACEYFGEAVTQLEHALQAAQLAMNAGATDEVVVAALLHDIGHLLEADRGRRTDIGAVYHGEIGGHYLSYCGFSPRVVQLVRGHVKAKRYLTAVDPAYYEKLSEASRQTLSLQGGPMSPAEVAEFEADPLMPQILQLRYWDEQAKEPGMKTLPLERYRPLLEAASLRPIN